MWFMCNHFTYSSICVTASLGCDFSELGVSSVRTGIATKKGRLISIEGSKDSVLIKYSLIPSFQIFLNKETYMLKTSKVIYYI